MKLLKFFFNLKYLPILLIYILCVFIFSENELVSDRLRYWLFSENLLNGYYFDSGNTLWNGPGYPIYIAFLRLFGFGWELIVYSNAILLYISILLFDKIIARFQKRPTLIVYLFAFWEPVLLYQYLPHLMTEVFVILLMALFVYIHLSKIKYKNIYLGLVLGLLILTKVVFFYVVVSMLALSFIIGRFREQKYYLTLFYSIIFCIPYLIYTYGLTGKYFYFSNSGGSSLYWMSVPDDVYRGDWNGGYGYYQESPNLASNSYNKYLKDNSWPIYEKIDQLNWIEKDELLKKIAVENIRDNKIKFTKNWVNNFGRLFFGYPFSFHTPNWQHVLITFKQAIFISTLLLAYFISIIRFDKININYFFLITFFTVYLLGVSLLSSYPRFLFITNIISWAYMIYIFKEFLTFKILKK